MQSELQNSKQQMQRNKISRGATKVLHIFQKGIHNTEHGITLVALIITTIFSYDENLKSSNNKGFLLQSI